MPDDDAPLKSSYELAMERLRASERESGAEEPLALTAAQKERIGAVRLECKARLAELEILHRDRVAAERDPEQLRELEAHYEIDHRRAESAVEEKVATIKRGE